MMSLMDRGVWGTTTSCSTSFHVMMNDDVWAEEMTWSTCGCDHRFVVFYMEGGGMRKGGERRDRRDRMGGGRALWAGWYARARACVCEYQNHRVHATRSTRETTHARGDETQKSSVNATSMSPSFSPTLALPYSATSPSKKFFLARMLMRSMNSNGFLER